MDNNEEKLPPFSYRKQQATNPYKPFIYALILSFGIMLGFVVNTITSGKQAITSHSYDKSEIYLIT